ncbi:hypothetical protein D3C78_1099010 [compost metagenome]
MLGQGFHQMLAVTAVLNTVIHPAQHAGGVFHRFLVANLAAARAEIGDLSTLIECGNFERASGTGGVFFEDERNVLALQMAGFLTLLLGLLQIGRKLQQRLKLRRGEIH